MGERLIAGADDTAIAVDLGVSRISVARERRRLNLPAKCTRWGEREHVKRGPAAKRRALEPRFERLEGRGHSDAAIGRLLDCNAQLVRAWRVASGRPAKTKRKVRLGSAKAAATLLDDPIYAAAAEVVRGTGGQDRNDLISDIVVELLSGEVSADAAMLRRVRRRYFGRALSLDAPLVDDAGDQAGSTDWPIRPRKHRSG